MKNHLIFAVILCGVLPGIAQAHEGHEHAEPKTVAVPAPGEGLLAESASSDVFELVFKHPPLSPGKLETAKIFLTDYASNAPIEKARIEIEAKGPAEFKSTASETEVPGIYESKLTFPLKGDYDLVIDIKAGNRIDTLVVRASATAQAARRWAIKMSTILWIIIAGLLLGIAAFVWLQWPKIVSLIRR